MASLVLRCSKHAADGDQERVVADHDELGAIENCGRAGDYFAKHDILLRECEVGCARTFPRRR